MAPEAGDISVEMQDAMAEEMVYANKKENRRQDGGLSNAQTVLEHTWGMTRNSGANFQK